MFASHNDVCRDFSTLDMVLLDGFVGCGSDTVWQVTGLRWVLIKVTCWISQSSLRFPTISAGAVLEQEVLVGREGDD